MPDPIDLPALLPAVKAIAHRAGAEIMRVYGTDFSAERKDDGSPLTEADTASEKVIVAGLRELTPNIPIIGEENISGDSDVAPDARFWLVDPLDGTREFLKRNDEFCVCIGLVENRKPIFGVLYGPALDLTYGGAGPGTATVVRDGKPERPISCRTPSAEGLDVLGSRSHGRRQELEKFLGSQKIRAIDPCGSALKFGRLAEGLADIYPRVGPTCEWDTAAGHAILLAAGGHMETIDGNPFEYGKAPKYLNPGFVAKGLD